jgi:predicted small secreted protein
MLERRSTARITGIAAVAAASLLLSACGTTERLSGWLTGKDRSETDEAVVLGAPDAETYLAELYELTVGDARKQAAIYEDASSAARLTPNPSSNLRLGLVLATPGHAAYDPARAQGVLRNVLSESELLTQSEIALASVQLRNAERLVGVTSEAARERDATSRAAQTEAQTLNRRIAAAEAENRRLRAELEDAQQKLEAITSIERSIREQE